MQQADTAHACSRPERDAQRMSWVQRNCLFFSVNFFSEGAGLTLQAGPWSCGQGPDLSRPGVPAAEYSVHGCHMGEDATAVSIVEPGLGLLGTVKLQPLVKPAPRVSSVTLTGGTKEQAPQALSSPLQVPYSPSLTSVCLASMHVYPYPTLHGDRWRRHVDGASLWPYVFFSTCWVH